MLHAGRLHLTNIPRFQVAGLSHCRGALKTSIPSKVNDILIHGYALRPRIDTRQPAARQPDAWAIEYFKCDYPASPLTPAHVKLRLECPPHVHTVPEARLLTLLISEYSLSQWHWALLAFTLIVAFAFEMVNGFHDTANAVATVIYTKSLKPWTAVILAGVANFLGIFIGGTAVAFAVVHLLPIDVLVSTGSSVGVIMIVSLLLAAFSWNLFTWYLGIPASSSHALVGSILGVGLASAWLTGRGIFGINWVAAQKVGLALLISPLLGFALALICYFIFKALVKDPIFFEPAKPEKTPPLWVRIILIITCTGVSLSHGSNDGQKGIGMVMLVLIAMLPLHYSLNLDATPKELENFRAAARSLSSHVSRINHGAFINTDNISPFLLSDFQIGVSPRNGADPDGALVDSRPSHGLLVNRLSLILAHIDKKQTFEQIDPIERWRIRIDLLRVETSVNTLLEEHKSLPPAERESIKKDLRTLISATEYTPDWVILAVAVALGMGTMIGWKRIVVTVGEKIGKTHLSYAQGASAEIVAMGTIGLASLWGMPVSTTHVLSSGIAGTMVASKSGVQLKTLRNIVVAWLLTLPAAMGLAAAFFIIGTNAIGVDLGNLKPLLDESQLVQTHIHIPQRPSPASPLPPTPSAGPLQANAAPDAPRAADPVPATNPAE